MLMLCYVNEIHYTNVVMLHYTRLPLQDHHRSTTILTHEDLSARTPQQVSRGIPSVTGAQPSLDHFPMKTIVLIQSSVPKRPQQ